MTQKPVFMEGIFTLRNLRSMGAAAIIEMAIALGVAALLIWQQLRPVAVQPQPEPHPIVDFNPPIPVLPHVVPTPDVPQTPLLSQVPSVPESIPSPTAVPLQPPSPPLAAGHPSGASTDLVTEFSASVLRAINDRKVYPKVAVLKGETGEAVVSFDYVDGAVSNIHVDKSSGFRDLDAAAVQAVREAVLPAKPSALANLDHFVFHLTFSLGG